MAASSDMKICPHCNAVLPATAAFCGDCGARLAGPPEPGPQASPTSLDDAPTRQMQRDPHSTRDGSIAPDTMPGGIPPAARPEPPTQPDDPPPPPPAAPASITYPVPPAAARPKRGGAMKWLAALVGVVVIIGCVAAWVLYLSPSHTNSPFFDRHGLQSNVPLPSNTTFVLKRSMARTDPTTNTTVAADAWTWTTQSGTPASLHRFYQEQLPKNGWSHLHSFTTGSGEQDITACQGNQALIVQTGTRLQITDDNGRVTRIVTAPSGGAALATELSSSRQLVHLFCSIT